MPKDTVLPTIEEEEEPPVVGFARATRLTDAFVHRLRDKLADQEYKEFKKVLYGINSRSVSIYDGMHAMVELFGAFPELLDEFRTYMPNDVVPGSNFYCYTAPSTKLFVRHGCSVSNLTQKSELEECPICLESFSFSHTLRTLGCGHSFCNPCLVDYLHARKSCVEDNAVAMTCPTCRQVTAFTSEVSTSMEKAYNALMRDHLRLQSRARLYTCPFEGCRQSLLQGELTTHMDVCTYRRYLCDQGCMGVLLRKDFHKDIGDCLRFVKGKLAAYESRTALAQGTESDKERERRGATCCAPS